MLQKKLQARLYILACLFIVFCSGSAGAKGTEAEAFVQRIKDAVSGKYSVESLFYLEGVDAELLKEYRETAFPLITQVDDPEISFAPVPENLHLRQIKEGYEFIPTVEPMGYVIIDNTHWLPYGEHDGMLYLMSMKRRPAGTSERPDIPLTIFVSARGDGKPVAFEGRCTILTSDGETRTLVLEDPGFGVTVVTASGQYIKSCAVTRLAPGGRLELRLTEGEKDIFFKTIDPPQSKIRYKRRDNSERD